MSDRSGTQIGNYRLIRSLGKGGFAEVYLGEHSHLGTPAAIKVLHQEHFSLDEQNAFVQEARIIASMIHPNIVRLLDFGFQDTIPYLIMDYAPGGTLRQLYARGTRLSLDAVINYARQVADALQFTHDKHLIHRDIKPENMLIGSKREVLVGDFGIALAVQSSRAQSTQAVIGTARYMAPEQILGRPHLACDQYALGIVVYEWLMGKAPFQGNFTEICAQHVQAPVPPLRTQRPDLLPDIELIISKALAKKPEERFPSIRDFVTALEEARQETVIRRSKPPLQLSVQPSFAPTVDAKPVASYHTPPPVKQAYVKPLSSDPNTRQAQAYEDVCKQLQENGSTGPYEGALVIPINDDTLSQIVYLQPKPAWLAKSKEEPLSAKIQSYTVQNSTITAAIFKLVPAGPYVAWTDQLLPTIVNIHSSKARVLNLTRDKKSSRNAVTSANNTPRQRPSPIIRRSTNSMMRQVYENLCKQLQKGGATGPYEGALVVPITDDILCQTVYLQSKPAWLAKSKKELFTAEVQAYTVQNRTITAAIFKLIPAGPYIAWTNQLLPTIVNVHSSQTEILDLTPDKKFSRKAVVPTKNTPRRHPSFMGSLILTSILVSLLIGIPSGSLVIGLIVGIVVGLITAIIVSGK